MFLMITFRLFGTEIKNSFFILLVLVMHLVVVISCVHILISPNIAVAVIIFIVAAMDIFIGLSSLIKYHNSSNNISDIQLLLVLYYFLGLVLVLVLLCKLSNSLCMPHLLLDSNTSSNYPIINTAVEATVEATVQHVTQENQSYSKYVMIESIIIAFLVVFGVPVIVYYALYPVPIISLLTEIQIRLSTNSFESQLFWVTNVFTRVNHNSIPQEVLYEILNWTSANLEVCTNPVYILRLTQILEILYKLLL